MKQSPLFNGDKIILSLCDFSGHWPSFYRKAGYDVRCFDLKKTGDVRLMLHTDEDLYGVLCAPPCTEFTVSGNQYWPAKDADGRTVTALSIVDACLRVVVLHPELKFWALENPVGRLNRWLGEFEFAFDPCDFAAHLVEHPDWTDMLDVRKRAAAGEKLTARDVEIVKNCNVYPKKTLLWGKFNHPIKCRVEPITVKASNGDKYSPIHMATGGKSEKTKTIRSETPLGFAQAFYEANQ
jgi:hypothetical protein